MGGLLWGAEKLDCAGARGPLERAWARKTSHKSRTHHPPPLPRAPRSPKPPPIPPTTHPNARRGPGTRAAAACARAKTSPRPHEKGVARDTSNTPIARAHPPGTPAPRAKSSGIPRATVERTGDGRGGAGRPQRASARSVRVRLKRENAVQTRARRHRAAPPRPRVARTRSRTARRTHPARRRAAASALALGTRTRHACARTTARFDSRLVSDGAPPGVPTPARRGGGGLTPDGDFPTSESRRSPMREARWGSPTNGGPLMVPCMRRCVRVDCAALAASMHKYKYKYKIYL